MAAHMRQCAAQPLPSLLRSGCAYLMQVCSQGLRVACERACLALFRSATMCACKLLLSA